MKNFGLAGIFFLIIISQPSAQVFVSSPSFPSAETEALGGPHAALANGIQTLFQNPAGFRASEPELAVSELTFGASGPIFDILNLIFQSSDPLADMVNSGMLNGINAGMDIVGPIYFGYVGEGLGVGFFMKTGLSLQNSAPLVIKASVTEDLLLIGGYSFRVFLEETETHLLDIGISLKGAFTGETVIEKSFLELLSLSLGTDLIMAEPFDFTSSIGFDLGFRYQWSDVLAVGLVAEDLYSPSLISSYGSLQNFIAGTTPTTERAIIPLSLNIGVLWSPRLGYLGRYISDFKVLLDYEDILDFVVAPSTATNPILHLGIGTEITLLEILDLRAGFCQGLFSAGFGVDLTWFSLQMAMYGREASTDPGLNPQFNLRVGLEFSY
jgi:hypothetical protein